MIDTIDTAEFKTASKLVSMVTLGIDTIDTEYRHHAVPRRTCEPLVPGPMLRGGVIAGTTVRSAGRWRREHEDVER